jgi:hypothetical protein
MPDEPYCIWCGLLESQGHEDECPTFGHEKKKKDEYVAFHPEFLPIVTSEDNEYNMHLMRMSLLLNIHRDKDGKVVIGIRDEGQKERLALEAARYMARHFSGEYLLEKGHRDPARRMNASKKYLRRVQELKEFADAWLPEAKKEQLYTEYNIPR